MNENKENKRNSKLLVVLIGIALLILIVLLMILFYKQQEKKPGNLTVDTTATDISEEKEDPLAALKDRQVYFAGYDDLTAGQDTVIELSNLPDNAEILMKYDILDAKTMESIYQTDLIESGLHVSWCPAQDLEPGTYQIIFHQMPYYPYAESDSGYLPLTNASNEITLTVTE